MGNSLVVNEGSVFVEKEVTEGLYVPEAAGSSAVEVLSDGLEFTPSREALERNNRTSSVETVAGRVGIKSMSGSVPVELKAGTTDGALPRAKHLWEALLGDYRQGAAQNTTKSSGNTATKLQIEDADIVDYAVGDIIKIEEAGAHVVTPITAVDDTGGAANITVLIPHISAYTDSVTIAPFSTFFHASGAPTLSITNYLGGDIREKAIGMRPVSAEISNFATGQLAEVPFSLEGLDFDRAVGTPLYTPSYDTVEPPVILSSCIFIDGVSIDVNSFSLSIANEVGFKTSTCSENGRISSRITRLNLTGSINPYMEDDDVARFDLFNENTSFSLFVSTGNPDSVSGELKECIGIYLPNCKLSELQTGDEDGIHTDIMNYIAHKTLGNDSVFIGFI